MILKLQRPLASNMIDPRWLAYDRLRKQVYYLLPSELGKAVLDQVGSDAKAYFHAVLVGDVLVFGKRVAEQKW